jgi:hypothetical protein
MGFPDKKDSSPTIPSIKIETPCRNLPTIEIETQVEILPEVPPKMDSHGRTSASADDSWATVSPLQSALHGLEYLELRYDTSYGTSLLLLMCAGLNCSFSVVGTPLFSAQITRI